MQVILLGTLSTLLTTGLGLVALSRTQFDWLGRTLLAFIVGQVILTVSAGVLHGIGIPFGVIASSVVGLAIAFPIALLYQFNAPTTIASLRQAAAALTVFGFYWALQASDALNYGIHHYDFTFYHDVMSRSLARTGHLSEPYLDSIGYGGWYLVAYGSSVVIDALNAILVGEGSRLAWWLNSLALPALLLLLLAQRAGPVGALAAAIAFAILFPPMLLDVRPNYTTAILLGIASLAALTSRAETRDADAVLIAIATIAAVFAKREAFVIFFFPCLLFVGILIRERAIALAVRFGATAGIPVFLTLVYRIAIPDHAGLLVGSSSQTPLTALVFDTIGIVSERLVTNNGQLAVAVALGLIGAGMQKGATRRFRAFVLVGAQLLAFALFVYATHSGGSNNYSTDWRKAAYPLIVAIAVFGVGVGALFRPFHIRASLAASTVVAIGITAFFGRWDYYTRTSGTYALYLQQQANWTSLLESLDLEEIDVLFLPGETFNNPNYLGSHILPQGLYAAIYPRRVRMIRDVPEQPTRPLFLVSTIGPIPALERLNGRMIETSWGLRFWTAEAVPQHQTNGWSLENKLPDIEAAIPIHAIEEEIVLLDAWGSVAAIGYAEPGRELGLTILNNEELHLTRMLLDPYPGIAQDAPVHVEVFEADGTLIHSSAVADLATFGSWIIPLRSRSSKLEVIMRVGETGTLRFFRPRIMTLTSPPS